MTNHWTNENIKDFAFAVAMDFVSGLELIMEEKGVSQRDLASRLGISEGRVSQVINNPGNLTLRSAVEWGRALGCKVALLAYDDGDEVNANGPVFSDVFRSIWEALGKPVTGAELETAIEQVHALSPNKNEGYSTTTNDSEWKCVESKGKNLSVWTNPESIPGGNYDEIQLAS